jgi:hypothetical protein
LAVAAPAVAVAQQPTPAQIEKAKKAFGEGRKLFDAGDFPEAVAKFKESYNLSKNPVLLYNIGFANEKAGQDDIALFYYRKFLTDAPADAAQRAEVTERVKELEKKFQTGNTSGGTPTPEPAKPEPATPEPAKPLKIKPAGTYTAADFQHQVVDAAPPKKALDITAFVPEDSGFEVTLYFRTAGEGKFTSKVMRWRYKELVGRIPPEKMIGDSVQYYIEVKDTTGAVVTRQGKSTSPNLVTLEAGATERFYPDFSDEGTVATPAETKRQDLEEDPLNKNKNQSRDVDDTVDPDKKIVVGGEGGGGGFTDPTSNKFKYMKWGSTGTAVAMVGLSILFNVQAGKQASALEEDVTGCGSPPCRKFDSYAQDVESSGKMNQTLSNVTLVIGAGAAVVAGYYWYKSLKAPKANTEKAAKKSSSPETSWAVLPAAGDGYAGAAALIDF